MPALLILATIADIGLAALLVAVSGFILEGVNGGGPQMPEAILYILFVMFAVAAPLAAWLLRARDRPGAALLVACAPIVLGLLVLALEPLFV